MGRELAAFTLATLPADAPDLELILVTDGDEHGRPMRERLAENARIAEEFVAADDAVHEAAGVNGTNATMEAALDVLNAAEWAVAQFPARSFEDLVVLARLAKAQISLGAVFDETCGILANHILALSKAAA